jgi:hypothetical protein
MQHRISLTPPIRSIEPNTQKKGFETKLPTEETDEGEIHSSVIKKIAKRAVAPLFLDSEKN